MNTHLTFGDDFNQWIGPNILPDRLTHLTFGNNFNMSLPVLPNNLIQIKFGDD